MLTLLPDKLMEKASPPTQPKAGHGGSNYMYKNIKSYSSGDTEKDYWLFHPSDSTILEAPVVLFLHGYSAYNPMVYGKWIKHLALKGNIVIFPRYQKGMFGTSPKEFVSNTKIALDNALAYLDKEEAVKYNGKPISIVGHSFGGAITANMLTKWDSLNLPEVKSAFLVSPGTGPMKKFVLDTYADILSDVEVAIIISEEDYVVGDGFGVHVFNTATNTKNRILFKQYKDSHGSPEISAGHLESYSPDAELDSGEHGYSYKRAKTAKTDAVDFFGYWKIFDALSNDRIEMQKDTSIFEATTDISFMGLWSDNTPVKPLKIYRPQ